jgi:hypothetical protein
MKLATIYKLLSLLFFFTVSSFVFCQNEEYRFDHAKSLGDKQIVYFEIIDFPDDFDEQTRVLEILLSDENVNTGNIYYDDVRMVSVCKLEIKPSLTVDYIDKIVSSAGYEMDKSDLSRNQKENQRPATLYSSDRFSFFDGFNGYEGYDQYQSQKISPEDYYHKQKEEWISKNPEKYKESKSQQVEKIVIDKKDLEIFIEKKRDYILSHPEIYIIED